ncbi:hypothetical protein ACHAWU_007062 [Discostella pseudostelligera]|uniref:Uncharacterized protein n=1 Tax=Discostella pseudostelligera TaxID=259834 RepID=A0ABD3MAV3_9STRA
MLQREDPPHIFILLVHPREVAAPIATNSALDDGGASGGVRIASNKLWVVPPEPIINTPSSRNGDNDRPNSTARDGVKSIGMDT